MKTGVAFGDYIFQDSHKRKNWNYEEERHLKRNIFLPAFAFILFAVIFLRLFFLQVIQGYYYRNLSDNNRTKTIAIHAPRGIIMDRNGTPLVFNVPGFRENVNGKTVLIPDRKSTRL